MKTVGELGKNTEYACQGLCNYSTYVLVCQGNYSPGAKTTFGYGSNTEQIASKDFGVYK